MDNLKCEYRTCQPRLRACTLNHFITEASHAPQAALEIKPCRGIENSSLNSTVFPTLLKRKNSLKLLFEWRLSPAIEIKWARAVK
jgi:hypothetical protein